MSDWSLKRVRERATEFEAIVNQALEDKYAGWPADHRRMFLESHPVKRFDLDEFITVYVEGHIYPIDRLGSVIHDLFDLKLQLYFLVEVDLGLYNHLVWDRGYDQDDPLSTPHLLITRMSLDQSLIAKSRILWERIMNFVYRLETGDELDNRTSRRRSKRAAFFEFASGAPAWRFLVPYANELEEYENKFRTPEFHKGSVLRAELLGNKENNATDLLKLLNRAMNVIWENVLQALRGEPPSHFTDLHTQQDGSIDPEYTERLGA